jgi:hypothetical protein
MPPGRLPAQVARCDWGRTRSCAAVRVPRCTLTWRSISQRKWGSINPHQAAANKTVSAAAFKADVKTAVLTTEMKQLTSAAHAQAAGRSTVAEYLSILGPAVTEFPNNLPSICRPYRGAQLKLLFRAGLTPVAHTTAKRTKTSAFCDNCTDETAEHSALERPAFQELQLQLLAATGPGASYPSRPGRLIQCTRDACDSRRFCKYATHMVQGGSGAEHKQLPTPAYVAALAPLAEKRALAQMRLSGAPIQTNLQRGAGAVPYSHRLCPRGCAAAVDTEQRVLFECLATEAAWARKRDDLESGCLRHALPDG